MRVLMLIVAGLLCGPVVVPAVAQGQAPNRRDIVERVSADPASNFACAHVESCGDAKWDWVKAVAWALYQADPRFGLNMKRDDDRQGLSMDAIAFRRGPTERDVEVYDICGSCGDPKRAAPAWQDVTDYARFGQPGHARWVKPSAPATGGGGGTGGAGGGGGVVTPAPVNLQPLIDAIAALGVKVDAVAGLALAARDAAQNAEVQAEQAKINASDLKHLAIPELKTLIERAGLTGCMVGRVPKAFGGSTEVRFCPAVP